MANILVVDDEPGIRGALREVLRDAGYGVTTAANGDEALKRMRERAPDGVVLDLSMPVMDGKTFLAACRAEPAYAQLPVALFTTTTEARTAGLDVQAYISKPFDLDELIRAVWHLVGAPATDVGVETPAASAEVYRWAIAFARVEVVALWRLVDTSRERLDRTDARILASNLCLNRAIAHIGASRQPASLTIAA